MDFKDYIIASHRVRVTGPFSDLVSLGLECFQPFVGEISSDENLDEPIIEIVEIDSEDVITASPDTAELDFNVL